jgi:hypothetical protein
LFAKSIFRSHNAVSACRVSEQTSAVRIADTVNSFYRRLQFVVNPDKSPVNRKACFFNS